MRIDSKFLLATALVAVVALVGCPKGGLPGGGKIPGSDKVPGGLGAGTPGSVDPEACAGLNTSAAGKKLHAFLSASKELEKATADTLEIVKNSCILVGNEIGMTEADYKGEAKDICAAVYGRIDENLKVSVKSKAAFKLKVKPAVCKVDIDASAQAGAECEGKATADIGATCTGNCSGKCDGTCASKGGDGQCAGECKGTCHGSCEGKADVNASVECKASASVKASADVKCTPPEVTIDLDAKLVVDKAKAEATLKGLKAGLPKIFEVKQRLIPLAFAVETWVHSAKDLKDAGLKLGQQFKDQAGCVVGQVAAAANMIGHIQANVSVSVEVSASASGKIGN